jgi:hypothetical protein
MILLSLNACCVRRSRNVPDGRYQIAPCWDILEIQGLMTFRTWRRLGASAIVKITTFGVLFYP